MNNDTKLEIAIEIIAKKIAKLSKEKKGIIDEEMKTLLDEREKMYKYDETIIDKIINKYGKEIEE